MIIFRANGKKHDAQFMLGNQNLEVIDSYKYLGITISSSGSYLQGINKLAQKGRKALFSLRSGIDIYLLNNPKLVLKLYDCMIKPILIYGAEVWGQQFHTHLQNNLKNIESIEFGKLQSKICKQLLGVGRFISNLAARAGLGRIPVCFYIMKCILRYWIKIENSNQSKLLFQCLLSEKKLCYDGIPS